MHTDREPIDLDALSEMGYEKRDINMGALKKWIFAFFGLGFVFFAASYGFYVWLAPKVVAAGSAPAPVTKRVPAAPNPLLQNNVETKVDIMKMRQDEVGLLTSYAWVDAGNGVVRMPIERAKELIAERGANVGPSTVAPVRTPGTSAPSTSAPGTSATGTAGAGDTAPRTDIPTSEPTRDSSRNGGVTDVPSPGNGAQNSPQTSPQMTPQTGASAPSRE